MDTSCSNFDLAYEAHGAARRGRGGVAARQQCHATTVTTTTTEESRRRGPRAARRRRRHGPRDAPRAAARIEDHGHWLKVAIVTKRFQQLIKLQHGWLLVHEGLAHGCSGRMH